MTQVQQTQAFILQPLIPLTHLKPENEESKDRAVEGVRYLKKCILIRPGPLFRLTLAGLGKLVRALTRPTLGPLSPIRRGSSVLPGSVFWLSSLNSSFPGRENGKQLATV